jgi:hypothetical protein
VSLLFFGAQRLFCQEWEIRKVIRKDRFSRSFWEKGEKAGAFL